MTHVLKKLMMVAALLVATFFAVQPSHAVDQSFTPSGPNEAQVILDLDSGEITVDIGSGLGVFGLETLNTTGFFDNAAAATAVMDFEQTYSAGTQNDQAGIGVLLVSGLPTGSFNLGPIIPEGSRTIEALTDVGFNFRFFSFAEGGSPNFGIGDPPVILVRSGQAIPEPGSLCLLAMGGVAAIARRRRK